MKSFLGPLEFLWDVPKLFFPEQQRVVLWIGLVLWRTALVIATVYVGLASIYYEYFLWTADR